MSLILAANLKLLVEERGLSMKELSRSCGAGDTLVYDIINGRAKSPKIETIEKLAAKLDVTVQDLLSENRRSQAEHDLLAAFDQLPPADRQRLIATALAWLPQEG